MDTYLEGLMIALVSIALFLAARLVLAGAGVAGVAVSEWLALAAVPVGALLLRGRSVTDDLGLRSLPPRGIGAAILLGLGALPMAWFALWMASVVAPVDAEVIRSMGRELVAADRGELILLLGLAAVTPAVCEEILFRGLLLNTLLRRHSPPVAIGVSALVFSVLHWTPSAVARVAPTFVLGLILGWAVWRSRSLWVGVLVHLVYNATLLVGAAASLGPGPARPQEPPTLVILVGVAFLAAGTHFLMLGSPTSRPPTASP